MFEVNASMAEHFVLNYEEEEDEDGAMHTGDEEDTW